MSAVSADGTCPVCGLTAGTYQPAPHHIPPGTILMNRYLLGRVLGEGGFGITYLACDLRLDLKVAIKEYFPTDKATRHSASSLDVTSYTSSAADSYESNKRKFLSEARTMAKMEKQAEVVGVRDFFEVNNTAYIVMEYVDGTTFRDLVKQEGGRIPTGKLLKTIEPLFSALSAMHDAGLVHRDISPDNLMLEQGRVRLLDFGCARESATGTSTLTIALKHGYAPIEQYTNHGQGPWTDIYSLGATIYFCLTGKSPVRSTDRLLGDELILPSKIGIDLSREQEAALLRAMAIQPRRRFQSMEEFRAALYEAQPAPAPVHEEEIHREPPQNNIRESETGSIGGATAVKLHTEIPTSGAPQEKHVTESVPASKSNRRLIGSILAVAAVTLAAVGITLGVRSRHAEPVVPAESLGSNVHYEVETTPVNDSAQPFTLDTSLSLNTENYQYFLDALADPEISEIHITGDGLLEAYDYVNTVISKPVYLDDAHMICYFPVEIVEGGHLIINSNSDFHNEGYIRTRGGGKITVHDNGSMSVNGILWLEDSSDIGNYYDARPLHRWEFNEAAVAEAAVHVSSIDELIKVMETTGNHIVIDADMTISQGSWNIQDRTVIISPGVTVTSETEGFHNFGTLINYGTLILNDRTGSMTGNNHLVNYGTLQINTAEGYYVLEESLLLNLGTLLTGAPDQAEIHFGNTINMGRIEAVNPLYFGGTAINSGSIAVSSVKATDLGNTNVLINWGSITTNRMENYGYILTGGDISAGYLYNIGLLDECTNYVSPEGEIYISSIESSRGICSLRHHDTDITAGLVNMSGIPAQAEHITEQKTVNIATEAALLEYANSDYDWLIVTADITCHQDLELKQNLLIEQGKTLRFDTGKTFRARGVAVSLQGSLTGDSLIFEDGSRLVVNGATMALLSGYELILRDESACYLNNASIDVQRFSLQGCSIGFTTGGSITCSKQLMLEDNSRLMLADGVNGKVSLNTPELAVSCSRVTSLTDQTLRDMQLKLHQGQMDILMPLTLSDCYVENGRNSGLYNSWNGCLTIRGNSTLINDGILYEDGAVYLYCDTVNNGEITATDLFVSGSFVNNNKVTLYGDLIDHSNVYTGAEPIYIE